MEAEQMLPGPLGLTPLAGSDDILPMVFFAPFVSSRLSVLEGSVDSQGNLSAAGHASHFEQALQEALGLCGIAYADCKGLSHCCAAVEKRISYRRAIKADMTIRITVNLLAVDEKRIHCFMEMREAAEGWLVASCETVAIYMHMAERRPMHFPASVRRQLEEMRASHALLPSPLGAGEGVRLRRKVTTSTVISERVSTTVGHA
jgi:acyl-CoA thioester hydrolase